MILAFLLPVCGYAQTASPREELKQLIEQLQKTPTDSALREKIIKLAVGIKPAPAIPEDALRREGRAKFAFKNAKSNDDYLGAAREYEEAVLLAPWVSGYYSDLCTIYEKAEEYAEAKRNCELSSIGLTEPSQVNEIKQRIAGLEFGIEKANEAAKYARENSPEAQARKDDELVRSLDQALFVRGDSSSEVQLLVDGKQLKFMVKRLKRGVCTCGSSDGSECSGPVGEVRLCTVASLNRRVMVLNQYKYTVALDGNSITEVWVDSNGKEASGTLQTYKRR